MSNLGSMPLSGGRHLALGRWLNDGSPARAALLQPLTPQLLAVVPVPSDVCLVIEPLRTILDRARVDPLPTDRDGELLRTCLLELNDDLGFESPAMHEGSPTYLEAEMLIDVARIIEALDPDYCLTPLGFTAVDDPARLWHIAASAMLWWPWAPWLRTAWEVVLAWLLSDEDTSYLSPALGEIIGDGGDVENKYTVAFYSLYTLARGLSMFTPAQVGQQRPHLTHAGRATALRALQARAASYLPDPVLN